MRCDAALRPYDMLQPEAAALPAGMLLSTPILYSKLMHELVQLRESCEVAASALVRT